MNGRQALVGWMGVGLIFANIFEGPFKQGFAELLTKDGNTHGSSGGLGSITDPGNILKNFLRYGEPVDPHDITKLPKEGLDGLRGLLGLGPSTKAAPTGPGQPPEVAPSPTGTTAPSSARI